MVHTVYQGNATGLFYHGSAFPIPEPLRAGTWIHAGHGYDAQFYRFAARDPLLRRGFGAHMDDAALRYRRILIPALASLASPLGIAAVDLTYLALVLAAIGAGVWFTAALAAMDGRSVWWGLLFLSLPATIASLDRALLDGPLCAAVAAVLYFYRRGWHRAMLAVCVAAPLIRETGLLLPIAGAASALFARRFRHSFYFLATAAPFALWSAYVALHTPATRAGNIVSRPLWGLFARLTYFRTANAWTPALTLLIQALDIAAVIGLLAAVALAAHAAWRRWPEPGALLGILFCLLAAALAAPDHLLEPFGFLRPVSPLLLWVSLESLRTRRSAGLLPLAATGLATSPGPMVTLLKAVLLLL